MFKRLLTKTRFKALGVVMASVLLLAACGGAASPQSSSKPSGSSTSSNHHYLIYLSLSYIGNDWQPEAKNMITALAATPPYDKEVTLRVTVAGTDVERQIAQINSAVAAGAKGIVVYPISPTALNATIERACAKGVKVFAYDSVVTAPCAYNTHVHQHLAGVQTATWLADQLNGKGNVVMITGVPGTSVDTARTNGALSVFKKYPGIHIIASVPGDWAQAPAKQDMSTILLSHPASTINGIWAQVGCYAITQLYLEHNYPLVPCAGEQTQGHLTYMLSKAQGGVDLPSVSYSATTFTGAVAFKNLVALLNGKKVPKTTYAQYRLVTNRPVSGLPTIPLKLCTTGTAKELAAGCNVFASSLNVAPGFFTSFWSPQINLGLNAALTGSP